MKNNKILYITFTTLLLIGSCKQEVITTTQPVTPTPGTPSKGSGDFTKFVAVGNSFVAGMQAYALFDESQANSIPKIIAKQLETVGGATTWNQPDIGSVNGYNPVSSVFSPSSVVPVFTVGRYFLFDPDGPTVNGPDGLPVSGTRSAGPAAAGSPPSTVTCPSTVSTPASPAPYNTANYPTDFTGSKPALNNFGIPLIFMQQLLTPATGGPASTANPAYNVFFKRFAVTPSPDGATGSTILGDAKAAAGTFYMIWFGFDDVLLYAATGADGATAGTYPMTATANFTQYFNLAISAPVGAVPALPTGGLTTGTTWKGVVGNIPDFTSLPYFTTVPWNTINTLDAATVTSLTIGLATPYNGFLDAMAAAGAITTAERDKRKLSYVAKPAGNGVLMVDESLTDLTSLMNANGAGALVPFARARQANSSDLVPLAAGAVLGTCVAGPPPGTAVYGVSYPVPDRYMLTSVETFAILTRTNEFNGVISSAVTASNGRLFLADVRKGYNDLVTNKSFSADGVVLTPTFAPPTGTFSEDGIHPNNRGAAFTANIFINAINTNFAASIPNANLSLYSTTKLPANP